MKLANLMMTLLIAGGTALSTCAEITMRDVLQLGLVRGNDIAPLKAGVSALATNHADRIYAPAGQPAWIDGAGGVWRIDTVTNWVVTLPQGFGYNDEGDIIPPPAYRYTIHEANGGTDPINWYVGEGDWTFGIEQGAGPYVSFLVLYRDDYGIWTKHCQGVFEYQVTAPIIANDMNSGQIPSDVGYPSFSRSVSIVTNRIDNVAVLSAVSNIVQSAINAHIQALHP